jgi:hypothetical protein
LPGQFAPRDQEKIMTSGNSRNRRNLLWIAAIIVAVVIGGLSWGRTRRLAGNFFISLRQQKVQTVNVNLSSFVGPNANRSLQQMVSQMISDTVKVTTSEKAQTAPDAATANRLAGFQVQLLGARKDAPQLSVRGVHAFQMTINRARLQAILQEAGRSDLTVPATLNGATVAVKIPRTVLARYGTCPGRPSPTANIATPTPNSTQYNNCVILNEGPSPQVNAPSGLDLGQLTQIGLEVAGMTPAQARQFLQTVSWKSMLGVPVPRFMRSYASVQVNGVGATLLDMAGRRGPTYTLIWARNGMVYSLIGYGDSAGAVTLADSLR